MWTRRTLCYSTTLVLLCACSGSAVLAQETESGALPGVQDRPGSVRLAPADLDDAFQPIDELAGPVPPSGDLSDLRAEPQPAGPPLALWQQLAALDAEERANAQIDLELGSAATDAERESAAAIAASWNAGEYEPAIEALRSLEADSPPLGLGIAWRVPQASFGLRGVDVRVGSPRVEAAQMALDFDAQNGNLFAVIQWGSTSGTAYWTMNMSTDDGATWSETYSWFSSVGIIDVDGVVVDNYIYVAYVVGNATSEGRLRRCLVSTGGVDGGYGFQTVINAAPATIEEVALASNAADFDNRIYYFAIQSNDVLRYFWDVASDGTTFTDGGSPAVADAEFGLDATWDHNWSSCTRFLYVSYAGSDGNIHVQGRSESAWTDWVVESGTGSYRNTSISAYADTLICAFEYGFPDGQGIRYRISYDCGGSWNFGNLAIPDGTTVYGYHEPDVDARDGDGTACIYQAEVGLPDHVYYRTRQGFAPGPWSDPVAFNDLDVYTGGDMALSHVPPLGSETLSHGALYIEGDVGGPLGVYFDRPGAGSPPCDDITPPVVDLDAPATLSCACDLVDIVGSVSDPDGTYVGDQLEYRRSDDPAWTVADSAIGARSGVLYTWDTSALAEGFYYVRVVGENECGLTASDSKFVFVSNTFGNAELRSPVSGGIYGGIVCVDGTAWTQSCFDQYTVDYRPAGGGAYSPVDPPNSPYTNPVINDPLASWNTASGPTAVPDGDYELRLLAATDCGDTATVGRRITVDNTAPTVRITSPAACDSLEGVVQVIGTVTDANLAGWTLQYTGGNTSGWVTIVSGTTPVVNGLLANWDVSQLPACCYTLRLTASDQAVVNCDDPHWSEFLVSVSVNECTGDLDGDGDIDLADLALLLSVYGTQCD